MEKMENQPLKGIDRESGPFVSEDAFLSKLKIGYESFEVPGLGNVQVKPLALDERNKALEASTQNGKTDSAKFTAMIIILGMVSPKIGLSRIPELVAGHPKIVDTISKKILEISGLANPEQVKNV